MKFAILTSGGDAPGMNDVVIELLHAASKYNHQIYLVNDGYEGLLNNDINLVTDYHKYDEYSGQAGSFIYSSRCLRLKQDYMQAVKNLQDKQIDCLIVVGGDGSYMGSRLLSKHFPTMFIPGSIDNNVSFSDYALGFASATAEIVLSANKIKMTAKTRHNIHFLEVMGKYCSNLATAASEVFKPALTLDYEHKLTLDQIVDHLDKHFKAHDYGVVIVAEHLYTPEECKEILQTVSKKVGCTTRWNVLGFSQRGADVVKEDMKAAADYAKLAMEELNNKHFNLAIVHDKDKVVVKSFDELDKLGFSYKG